MSVTHAIQYWTNKAIDLDLDLDFFIDQYTKYTKKEHIINIGLEIC